MHRSKRWHTVPIIRLLAAFLAFLCGLALCGCQKKTREAAFRIHFLDVVQGDSALIRTEQGDILIDAGGEGSEGLLCAYLQELGVRELALVVFTSPDPDRVGGGDGVLRAFSVGEVWFNGSFEENESTKRLDLAIDREKTLLRRADAGSAFRLGGAVVSVLFPLLNGEEDCMALQVAYGDDRAILMGELSREQERTICKTYDKTVLRSSFLAIGRNGSATATSEELLECVAPRYAVIACGTNNLYGYPASEVLTLLEQANVRVLRKDRYGEIVFASDGGAFYLVNDTDE